MRTPSCRRGVVVRLRRNLVRPQALSRRRCAGEVPAASRHRRLRAIIAKKRSVELPMSSVPSGVLPRDKSFYPSCSTHLRAHNSTLSYYNIHLRRNLHYQKQTSKRTCLLLPHICILASFSLDPPDTRSLITQFFILLLFGWAFRRFQFFGWDLRGLQIGYFLGGAKMCPRG